MDQLVEKIKNKCIEEVNEGDFVQITLTKEEASSLLKYLYRPTCGVEQRKFLDEVEKFKAHKGITEGVLSELFYIPQNVFEADLQKVLKGE